MKILTISIMLCLWPAVSQGYSCTAKPGTNDDPTVIIRCYTKMLIHFRDLLREELAFQYANHLTQSERLKDGKFRRKYYSKMFTELEQIQRLRHRLLYPDPRPAVRCEAPAGNSE